MQFLIAVDRGPELDAVVTYGLDVATAMDASVTIVHAIDPDVSAVLESEPISTLSDARQRLVIDRLKESEEQGQVLVERAESIAEERGISVASELLYGDPVPEITTYAEEANFNGIFVGHQSRSGRMERVVGSVAKGIVERATVPVTVVR